MMGRPCSHPGSIDPLRPWAGTDGAPRSASSASRRRASPWRGWPALVFAVLIVAGVAGRETVQILRNAVLLCLSCMGLGK